VKIFDILIHAGLFKPLIGVQNRYNNLTRQLRKRGASVVVLEPDDYVDAQDRTLATVYSYKELRLFGRNFCSFRDIVPSFVRAVFRIVQTDHFDLIQITHPSGASVAKLATTLARKRVPIVYAPHNVESDVIEVFSRDRRYNRLERGIVPAYFSALERLVCRHVADSVITVSEQDRNTFVNKFELDPKKVFVVPSGCTLTMLPSDAKRAAIRQELGISGDALCILFHGFYSYGPNREAFETINTYIAPKVAAVNDRALFVLAGTEAPVFERDNVKSLGFVVDLQRLLAIADVAVVPITTGFGTKLKVFDYMNAALPIVATRKAMEGIEATDGQEALIVETVGDVFIEALVRLLEDAGERRRLGANARQLLEAKYTWDAIGAHLVAVYQRILGGRAAL
jgi:glycosyltransferase involved in cell wall biosynthesis